MSDPGHPITAALRELADPAARGEDDRAADARGH